MVWYGMVWYGMVWYGMVWYNMKAHHLPKHEWQTPARAATTKSTVPIDCVAFCKSFKALEGQPNVCLRRPL